MRNKNTKKTRSPKSVNTSKIHFNSPTALMACLVVAAVLVLGPLNPVNALNAKLNSNNRPIVTKPTKVVLASVASAENQLYTKDNRLFVTGDNGIFELIAKPNNTATVVQRAQKQKCAFGGIAEAYGTLYVNCATFGSASLYAAKLTSTPTFSKIYSYRSVTLPNGLTTDSAGRLYVASTFKNQILRLTPSASNPLSITRTETWLNGSGIFTNGIKYANGAIYWTDATTVKRAALKADGTPDKTKSLLGSLSYFDDIAVDGTTILAADYTAGVIRSYDLNGRSFGTVGEHLNGPSSVARARAPFPAGSYIVTEKGASQVSLVLPK